MTDFEIELVLERVHVFKGMLVEAAFRDDHLWRNVYRLAGVAPEEELELRAYLVDSHDEAERRP